jgi:hypothetical protein
MVPAGCIGDLGLTDGTSAVRSVSADRIHVVGTGESIARIADLQPTRSGVIWVLNTTEPYFVAIDGSGEVVRSFGSAGGGPDEFRSPNALVGDAASDDVWVYDRGAHTLVNISGPEASAETVTLSRDSLPTGRIMTHDNAGTGNGRYWVRHSDGGFLFARARPGVTGMRQIWHSDLVEHDRDGGTRVLFSPDDVLGDPTTLFGDATEFLPFPLLDICPDGSVALYDPESNTLRRYSRTGALLDSDSLPAPRRVETTADRLFFMMYPGIVEQAPASGLPDSAALHGMLKLQWPDISAQMARVFPEYNDLHCVDNGVMWIQPLDVESGQIGRGPLWLRIDADGAIERIELPDEFRPLRFIGDRIWGVHRGELDIESVAWLEPDGNGSIDYSFAARVLSWRPDARQLVSAR